MTLVQAMISWTWNQKHKQQKQKQKLLQSKTNNEQEQPGEWDKIFGKHIFDKKLIFKI